MDVKRQLVLNLHKRGFRKIDIFRQLKIENFTQKFIHRTIKRYEERGTVDIQKKIGRKKSVCTKKLHNCVKVSILSKVSEKFNPIGLGAYCKV
jgi:hypothetical protein